MLTLVDQYAAYKSALLLKDEDKEIMSFPMFIRYLATMNHEYLDDLIEGTL